MVAQMADVDTMRNPDVATDGGVSVAVSNAGSDWSGRDDRDAVSGCQGDPDSLGLPQTDLEDEEEKDPRQRYVIRFRYKGLDPNTLTDEYMISYMMLQTLGIPREDILAENDSNLEMTLRLTGQRLQIIFRIRFKLTVASLGINNII
ncbi:UNVERIFIED_CONTAM: hypothetical protein K2H54_000248 [Gekko kuhli]